MSDEFKGYIYKISNDVNNKLYIGQTTYTVKKRWSDHISSAKTYNSTSMIIYNAMRKYGIENFHIEQLEEITASSLNQLYERLNEKEIYYIDKFNTLKPHGYNCTPGGNNISSDCKTPVTQYSLDGEFIQDFPSIREATNIVGQGRSQGNIQSCCNGATKTAWGYVWRYQGDPFNLYPVKHKGNRAVVQYSKEGIFIEKFETLNDAARSIGKFLKNGKPMTTGIFACCRGTNQSAHGYIWRYEGDPFDKYETKRQHYKRKVNVYDKDKNFIKTCDSVLETANELGVSDGSVIACCIHRANGQFCQGFRLFYANDQNQPDKSRIIA